MSVLVEEVVYDGSASLAEVELVDSEEPGAWVSVKSWFSTLKRMGIDLPMHRAHYYLGPCMFLLSRPHPFPCRCGHSVMAFTEQSVGGKKPNIKLELHTVDTLPALLLAIGQCPVCRRIVWAVDMPQGRRLPTWFNTTKTQHKSALVNGPPRRWR